VGTGWAKGHIGIRSLGVVALLIVGSGVVGPVMAASRDQTAKPSTGASPLLVRSSHQSDVASRSSHPGVSSRVRQAPTVSRLPGMPATGELVKLRTRTSRTFALSGGRRDTILYTSAVDYLDGAGAWQPIDSALVPAGRPGYEYRNAQNGFHVYFPRDLAKHPILIVVGSRSVSFRPQDGRGRPVVSGSTATYRSALPGVTLSYTVTGSAVIQKATLSGVARYTPLQLQLGYGKGVVARQVGQAVRIGIAGTKPLVSFLSGSLATDSSHPASPDQEPSVPVKLSSGSGGAAITQTASFPAATQSSSASTGVVSLTTPIPLNASPDCQITASNPTSNYCGTNMIRVGYSSADGFRRRGLLQFDTSGLTQPGITSATLNLDCFAASTTTPVTLTVHRVTQAWTSNVNWNTYDGTHAWASMGGGGDMSTTDYADLVGTYCGTPGWKTWDVTSLVQFWTTNSGTSKGIDLKETSPETTNNLIDFYSSDSPTNNVPSISVVTDPPPPDPTNAQFTGSSVVWSSLANGTVMLTGLQPASGFTLLRCNVRTSTTGTTWPNPSTQATISGTSCTSPLITAEGTTYLQFQVVDSDQNTSAWEPITPIADTTVRLDRTGPTLPTVSGGGPGWLNGASQTVTPAGSSDVGAGLDHYEYRTSTNGGSTWTPSPYTAAAALTISAEGETDVQFRALDSASPTPNVSGWAPTSGSGGTVRLDRTAPTLPTVTGGTLTWQSAASRTVTASGSTDVGGAGVDHYESRTSTNGGSTWSSSPFASGASATITAEGETDVQFRSVDAAAPTANTSAWTPAAGTAGATVRLDRTAPTLPTVTGGSLTWQSAASVAVTAADSTDAGGVGVDHYEYRTSTNGGATWSVPPYPTGTSATISAEGETDVQFRAVDAASPTANPSAWTPAVGTASGTVRLDRTAPTAPTVNGGSLTWQSVASVTVSASSSTDVGGAGVDHYEYRTSTNAGSTWSATSTGASGAITAEGETDVQFRAVDAASPTGNPSAWIPAVGTASATVRLDRTAPTVPTVTGGSLLWQDVTSVAVSASGSTDNGAGIGHYQYRTSTDGGTTWSASSPGTTVSISAAGETDVQFSAVDAASPTPNISGWAPAVGTAAATVRIDRGPAITSSSDPDPTQGYSTSTFDASWTDPPGMTGVQGYSVIIDDDSSTVPSATVSQTGDSIVAPGQMPGTHFLHVRAEGGDGRWSATATFQFAVFDLMSPLTASYTAGILALQAPVPTGAHDIYFQFRRADDFTWSNIPNDRLTDSDTNPASQPVQANAGTGDTAALTWDAGATTSTDPGVGENALDGAANDGPIEMRAVMVASGGGQLVVPENIVTIDRQPPQPLEITAPSDPMGTYLAGSDVAIHWTANPDQTDTAGYSVLVDASATTEAPATINTDASITSDDVADTEPGLKYLHIRAADHAGNWSATQTKEVVFVSSEITSPLDGTPEDGGSAIELGVETQDTAYICWEYGTAADEGWSLVPASDVTIAGSAVSSWPVSIDGGDAANISWGNFASAPSIDDYPGAIRLRAVAVPSGTSSCGNPSGVEVGTTSVEYQPDVEGTSDPASDELSLRKSQTQTAASGVGDGPLPPNGRIFYTTLSNQIDRDTTNADGSDSAAFVSQSGGDVQELGASADGTVVAYGGTEDGACFSAFTIDGTTGVQTVNVDGTVSAVAVSPDGTQIAYAAELCDAGGLVGSADIFLTSATAPESDATRSTAFQEAPTNESITLHTPVFTPDGTELMWQRTVSGTGGGDAGQTVEIAPIPGSSGLPEGTLYDGGEAYHAGGGSGMPASWDPHEGVLAVATGENQITLYTTADGPTDVINGTATNTIVNFTVPDGSVNGVELGPWSPDGQYFLVAVDSYAGQELVAYDPATSTSHVLKTSNSATYYPAAWTTVPSDPEGLALEYRPDVYFDSSERWMPMNPDNLFTEDFDPGYNRLCAVFSEDHHFGAVGVYTTYKQNCDTYAATTPQETLGEIDRSPGLVSPPAGYSPTDVELDLNDSLSTDGSSYHSPTNSPCDPLCDPNDGASVAYFHISEIAGVRYVQYWFFYRFNDSTALNVIANGKDQHQGDWEGVTVAIGNSNPAGRILWVSYSEHRAWYRYDASDLENHGALDGTHPLVFPAQGTHANYPDTCDSGCPNWDVYGIDGFEGSHDGGLEYANNDDGECAASCLIDITHTDWWGPDASGHEQWGVPWGLFACHCTGLLDAPTSPGVGANGDVFVSPESTWSEGSPTNWQNYQPPVTAVPRG
jgi:hypothetical protein